MIRNKSKNNGFSLIEVMLAVLVLAIGILGVSKLQTSLLRSGSDANYRSIAASIAQKKADDLKRFVYVNTSSTAPALLEWDELDVNSLTSLRDSSTLAFAHINDNEGGRIKSGKVLKADPGNGYTEYTLEWTVDNYYYSDVANSLPVTTAITPYPAFKTAHVVVSWDGVGDTTNNVVSFDTIIDSYNLGNTDLSGPIAIGGVGPVVNYDPLAAPDVLPITLGIDDLKKETSKPLPDVSKKGDSTLVQFETVTYNINNNTQRREEFRTLACNCTKIGATDTTKIIQGYVTWDPVDETIVDVTTSVSISATKTEPVTGGETQDDACTFCCRDGEDVVTSGNTTFKVCRLKRIDGVLRILDPWKLIAFNMIPASYFNDEDGISGMTSALQETNIGLYSSYVTTTVRDLLTTGSKSAFNSYSTVDLAFINDTTTYTNGSIEHLVFDVGSSNKRDIQVRGVYMDYPPTGIFTQITGQTTYYDASTVPLDRVPFYEVNLTQLAGWIPDIHVLKSGALTGDVAFTDPYPEQHDEMDGSDCLQDDIPSTARNYVTNEEFFHSPSGITTTCNNASRGEFHPISEATAETITSEIYTGSDGIVDRNITSNTTVDVSLDLRVVTP